MVNFLLHISCCLSGKQLLLSGCFCPTSTLCQIIGHISIGVFRFYMFSQAQERDLQNTLLLISPQSHIQLLTSFSGSVLLYTRLVKVYLLQNISGCAMNPFFCYACKRCISRYAISFSVIRSSVWVKNTMPSVGATMVSLTPPS